MRETPQQYVRRILGYLGRRNAVVVQRSTPRRLERLLRRLTRAQTRRRPAPGKWSIGEIMAHLAETELVGGYRIRTILSKNGTPIQAFDQDAWAASSNYAAIDPQRSLEMFRILRQANLSLVRSLPARKLRYFGQHAERGKETITRILRLYAGHDLNHLGQIQRIRQQLKRR